tara:strand:+ start:300 stop:737 length:438 start_codon:yes stop_codon:yes gene_type:complete
MFNQNTSTDMIDRRSSDTKIAVLQERLTSYEIMLNKIDQAIQIIGTTSQNISKMLAVHDERIAFNLDMENRNSEEHNKVFEKIDSLEKKIDDRIETLDAKIEEIVKFRWLVVGALVIASFAFSQSSVVVDILTPDAEQVKMEKAK